MHGPTVAASSPAPGRIRLLVRQIIALLLRDTNVVIWTVIVTNILRMASSMVLTRLLVPEAFGIVGLIGSVSFVLSMISDLGFQSFVVRHPKGDQPRFLDVIWTIRLVRAVVLSAVLALLAHSIAHGLGEPGIGTALAVSALQFLLDGGSALSVVTAIRERQIVRLSTLDIITGAAQVAVAIPLAFLWRNYWSMVAAMLISGLVRLILSYVMFPHAGRRIRFDTEYARELWHFARFVTGSSIITMLLAQSDKLVLARLMPLDMLGLYMLAGNLALTPQAFTMAYTSRVLYPVYARVWRERPEDLKTVFYAIRMPVSMLYMLAAGGLIGTAPLAIHILYDHRYAAAGFYLQLLAITPLLQLATGAANEVLTASGRVYVTFRANMAKLCWLAVVGPVCFFLFGPVGLIACVGTLELPTLLYSWSQLWRFGLFGARQELLLMACGGAGVVLGYGLTAILLPLI